MSHPLIFDGLLWVPVPVASLHAIAATAPTDARRRAARSLHLALAEHLFERRAGAGAVISRRELGARAGMSPAVVSQIRPLLVEAGVVKTYERDGGEHEWVIIDPRRDSPRSPSRIERPPVANRDASRARPSAVNGEEEKRTTMRAARAHPAIDEVHLPAVAEILTPALGARVLEDLVALNSVLAAHPEKAGHDHLRAATDVAAQARRGTTVHSPAPYLAAVLDEQARQRRDARPAGGRPRSRSARPVSDPVARGDALLLQMSDCVQLERTETPGDVV